MTGYWSYSYLRFYRPRRSQLEANKKQEKQTLQSPLFFRKTVEKERFSLRPAILVSMARLLATYETKMAPRSKKLSLSTVLHKNTELSVYKKKNDANIQPARPNKSAGTKTFIMWSKRELFLAGTTREIPSEKDGQVRNNADPLSNTKLPIWNCHVKQCNLLSSGNFSVEVTLKT